MQRIEDAVNGVLEAMRQRGVSEYSLKCIRWSVYRRIVVWHHTHDTDICSYELLSSLCELQRIRYKHGEISRKFYRAFVTAGTIIRAAPMMITCSIQSEEGSARKCPVILRRLLLKNMESWHRNSTRPFPMYTPIYLGTPALCTCIWQVCRWSLFPNGSAILSWRHL